jgi:glucose-1-phosphate thymidylyltransferase
MATSPSLIGLLPCGGRGIRFGVSRFIKELYPVSFAPDAPPRPVCEIALQQLRDAGATRALVVLAPDKGELVRVLADGAELGLPLGYVVQSTPGGLPDAVRACRAFLDGPVVLALPDTIVLPRDAAARVAARLDEVDLSLGVFPVEEPERLGPVELDEAGAVVAIHDKPGHRRWPNSWGIAAWSPRFTEFLCAWEEAAAANGGERAIGHAFEAARRAGLSVAATMFTDGLFVDLGTPRGLRSALAALDARGRELAPSRS